MLLNNFVYVLKETYGMEYSVLKQFWISFVFWTRMKTINGVKTINKFSVRNDKNIVSDDH